MGLNVLTNAKVTWALLNEGILQAVKIVFKLENKTYLWGLLGRRLSLRKRGRRGLFSLWSLYTKTSY